MKKLLFLVLLTGCHKPAGLPFYQTADRTPEWITPGAPEFAVESGIHPISPSNFD